MATNTRVPNDQDVSRYKATCQVWFDAYEERNLADTESSKCSKERNKLEAVVHSFRQEARRTRAEADEASASLLRHKVAVQEGDQLVEGARAVRDRALTCHGEKVQAFEEARARHAPVIETILPVETSTGNRKRSAPVDHGAVATKSAKAGASSAGKAARSRKKGNRSASAAVRGPDTARLNLFENLYSKVLKAELDLTESESSLDGMLQLCKDYRAVAAAESARVAELERVAEEDVEAWEEVRGSSEYVAACDACSAASVVAEEKTAAFSLAERNQREAEGVFRAALISGERRMARNKRVAGVLRAVHFKIKRENAEREMELSREPVILPESRGIELLTSGSSFGVAMLLAERKRAEKEKGGKKGRGAAAKGRAGGASGAAPRRSSRSTRGKAAEVFE